MAYRNDALDATSPRQIRPIVPAANTMQAVFDHISESPNLRPTQTRDTLSALRTLSRVTGRPLDTIPAQTKQVRHLTEGVTPARFEMSTGRWANVKSLVFKAIEIFGTKPRSGRLITEPSQAWQRLLDQLPPKELRIPLTPFVRWCTERGVDPEEVTQADAEAYGQELEELRTRSRPRGAYCAMVRAWNKATTVCSSWPPLKIVLDQRRNHYALPLNAFPTSFQKDVEAMIKDAVGADLMSSRSRRPIKPVSAESRRNLCRAFASALVHTGRDISTITCIADLVTLEAARQGLQFILDRQGGSLFPVSDHETV